VFLSLNHFCSTPAWVLGKEVTWYYTSCGKTEASLEGPGTCCHISSAPPSPRGAQIWQKCDACSDCHSKWSELNPNGIHSLLGTSQIVILLFLKTSSVTQSIFSSGLLINLRPKDSASSTEVILLWI
jgi:hypothetical protein